MNDYFCVLPFFSYEITQDNRKNIYCCRLAPGTDIENVRNSIKNHERSPACASCWRLEDQGLTSERQIHNRTYDFYADKDIERVEEEAVTGEFTARIVKLETSNLCNGTCVTCDSRLSSAWGALEGRPVQYRVLSQDHIDSIQWDQVIQLSFVGGEPLLERRNFTILQHLIDIVNTDCFVSIVTNGSCELTKPQLDILSKFKNLNICVSIDGVGSSFEYMRYPLKWSALEKNLTQFKQIAQHVSVSCMISNLNVFYYPELVKFFEQQNITYLCRQIEYPEYFRPGNLPNSVKQELINREPTTAGYLSIGEYSEELFQQCWGEIDRQDQLKNISIDDYLPEFAATRI